MAEGGYDYDPTGENENTKLDEALDNDGDDDEEEVNRTTPFQPGAASTPYPGGEEQIEMHTLPREQSGFDSEGIPLIDDSFVKAAMDQESRIDEAVDWLKKRFPKINLGRLGPIRFGRKPGILGKMVRLGPKGSETPIFKQDGSGLLKVFADTHKEALGPSAEEIIVEDRTSIREDKQRLKEAQRLEKTLNETAAKQQQAAQEKQAKEDQLEQINRRLANMETEGGTVIERQNETDRLNREKAKIERDIEAAKKKTKSMQQLKELKKKLQEKLNAYRENSLMKTKKQTLTKQG